MADLGRIVTHGDDPRGALAYAPLNADTRIRAIVSELSQAQAAHLDRVARLAERGTELHRADGRFDSILGILAHERGAVEAARAHFETALAKQPAERQALRHLLVYDVTSGDYERAARHARRLTVRSGGWGDQRQAVLAMAAIDEGRRALIEAFASDDRARSGLISAVMREKGPMVASEMVLAFHEKGVDGLGGSIGAISRRLIREGQLEAALILDRVTLARDRPAPTGFVNNDTFAYRPTGSAFDWRTQGQRGVALDWVGQRAPDAEPPEVTASFVRIGFLNTPLRLDNLTQMLVMRPGAHRLEVMARSQDLSGPAPISVILGCTNGTELATIPLDPIASQWQRFETDFEVPETGCAAQRIHLTNGFVPLSWSARYSGALDIARIQIVRTR
ncbi:MULTISPECIES: hypothetical protein [unclassified Roseitalea]|uniref:tetratricopeptide repeat protein n=1 Tax=unclassified Roseitalea TaxID=2639107 RepID=UPI00273D2F7D|nr:MULTISPECIES: hypothetical protein [unclassified Roseitalea]